jgi:hypothetical protein
VIVPNRSESCLIVLSNYSSHSLPSIGRAKDAKAAKKRPAILPLAIWAILARAVPWSD